MSDIKNPWGITPAEARALDSFCTTGHGPSAAGRIGISQSAYEDRLARARKKMKARGKFVWLLQWDRWRQSEGRGIPA